MNKVLKHFKSNAIIYLILITCIIVILIALLYKPKNELKEVDTSLFTVIDVDKFLKLFEDDRAKFIVVGNNTDQTTVAYADYVKFSMLKHNYQPYFIYQEDINFKKDANKIEELGELLDIKATYNSEDRPVIELIKEGIVPITILIKNKKPIYVYVGTMNTTTLDTLVSAYGISNVSEEGDEIA